VPEDHNQSTWLENRSQWTYSSISEVVAFSKIASVFGIALLFKGEVQVSLANVILTIYFLLAETGPDDTEETSVVYLKPVKYVLWEKN
jgi:hypothetical protein